jgi:acyl-CoA synthetase (AMP-forming)/AMP-acid ligase II
MGIGRGDRVAVVLPNGPEMAVAFLAVAAAATCAPLNPAYRAEEFDFYLSDLNVSALLVDYNVDSWVTVVAKKREIPVVTLSADLNAEAGVFTLEGPKTGPPEAPDEPPQTKSRFYSTPRGRPLALKSCP